MRKLWSLAVLLLAVSVSPARIAADPVAGLKRIGILYQDRLYVSQFETFRQGLAALGYAEGKNIAYDYRLAAAADLEQAARDMIRFGVDLIVAPATPAALAAKRVSQTVPILFLSADPVAGGLVVSLARPGGNATGVGSLSPELGIKRLELLREFLPRATRVAVLANPENPVSGIQLRAIESAAHNLGFELQILNVRRAKDLDAALATLNRKHVDTFMIVTDQVLLAQEVRIAEHALKNRLPGIYAYRTFADAGGLLAYGADIRAMWQQMAGLAGKILSGAKPADLPVQRPTKFELVVNLRTAKAIGINIPQAILLQADEVIR